MACTQYSRLIICDNHKLCILMKQPTFLKSRWTITSNDIECGDWWVCVFVLRVWSSLCVLDCKLASFPRAIQASFRIQLKCTLKPWAWEYGKFDAQISSLNVDFRSLPLKLRVPNYICSMCEMWKKTITTGYYHKVLFELVQTKVY